MIRIKDIPFLLGQGCMVDVYLWADCKAIERLILTMPTHQVQTMFCQAIYLCREHVQCWAFGERQL